AKRVDVRGDADMSMRETDRPTARVTMTLENGQVLTGETTVVRGDAANPASRDERIAKFAALATESIGAARVQQVVEIADRLGDLSATGDLPAVPRGPGWPRGGGGGLGEDAGGPRGGRGGFGGGGGPVRHSRSAPASPGRVAGGGIGGAFDAPPMSTDTDRS